MIVNRKVKIGRTWMEAIKSHHGNKRRTTLVGHVPDITDAEFAPITAEEEQFCDGVITSHCRVFSERRSRHLLSTIVPVIVTLSMGQTISWCRETANTRIN